ncbi:tyrosine-tRNA ligase cytoplasmic-like, partial [Trifolium medium]|nr:tyrosine-tRNA ligase cytoplasmic-like [Trifolium medium]
MRIVQPHPKTDVSCTVMLGEHVMRTSVGSVACYSLQNANISGPTLNFSTSYYRRENEKRAYGIQIPYLNNK